MGEIYPCWSLNDPLLTCGARYSVETQPLRTALHDPPRLQPVSRSTRVTSDGHSPPASSCLPPSLSPQISMEKRGAAPEVSEAGTHSVGGSYAAAHATRVSVLLESPSTQITLRAPGRFSREPGGKQRVPPSLEGLSPAGLCSRPVALLCTSTAARSEVYCSTLRRVRERRLISSLNPFQRCPMRQEYPATVQTR